MNEAHALGDDGPQAAGSIDGMVHENIISNFITHFMFLECDFIESQSG